MPACIDHSMFSRSIRLLGASSAFPMLAEAQIAKTAHGRWLRYALLNLGKSGCAYVIDRRNKTRRIDSIAFAPVKMG